MKKIPVAEAAHLYLWVPNALLSEGLEVMKAWGFNYKTNLIWYKIRKDGGPDRRGVGFYFRNVTEMILFGVRGRNGNAGATRLKNIIPNGKPIKTIHKRIEKTALPSHPRLSTQKCRNS